MSEPPREKCEACGGKLTRLISGGTGLIFKGSGFYITDYKAGSGSGSGATEKKPSEGESSAPASTEGKETKTKTETKTETESKPAAKSESVAKKD